MLSILTTFETISLAQTKYEEEKKFIQFYICYIMLLHERIQQTYNGLLSLVAFFYREINLYITIYTTILFLLSFFLLSALVSLTLLCFVGCSAFIFLDYVHKYKLLSCFVKPVRVRQRYSNSLHFCTYFFCLLQCAFFLLSFYSIFHCSFSYLLYR